MNSKVLIAIGGIALASLVGAAAWYYWPEPIPQFQVKNETGEVVAYQDLFEGKDYLLVVLLLPNCQVSKYSAGVVNEQYAKYSDRMGFVGLVNGSNAVAKQYAEALNLDFPVYGMRDAPDPFAMNELIQVMGKGIMVYGGTVVVADKQGDIVVHLEKEEVRNLPAELGK